MFPDPFRAEQVSYVARAQCHTHIDVEDVVVGHHAECLRSGSGHHSGKVPFHAGILEKNVDDGLFQTQLHQQLQQNAVFDRLKKGSVGCFVGHIHVAPVMMMFVPSRLLVMIRRNQVMLRSSLAAVKSCGSQVLRQSCWGSDWFVIQKIGRNCGYDAHRCILRQLDAILRQLDATAVIERRPWRCGILGSG
jgi:hypothetical protein